MDLGLRGRRAIVTGGSKGIGRAITELLIAEGADVAICARGKEDLDATVADFSGRGPAIFGDSVDVTDPEEFPAWIESAVERLGGLDVLILNAAAKPAGQDDATWELTFQSDVMQHVRALRVARPHLGRSDAASVVAISSITALEAPIRPDQTAYGTVKAAMLSYSGKMARQMGGEGIRMNVVSPGVIEFPGGMWERYRQVMPAQVDEIAATTAVGRLGEAEEVANAVVFLASPRASYITGSSLRVDGGIVQAIDW